MSRLEIKAAGPELLKLRDTDTNETVYLSHTHVKLLHSVIRPAHLKYDILKVTQPGTQGEGSWSIRPEGDFLRLYDHDHNALNIHDVKDLQELQELVEAYLFSKDEAKPKSDLKTYEIWAEGYHVTGESGKATLLASSEGTSFEDAVRRLALHNGAFGGWVNLEKMTYFGCRLFDNEHAARATYG